MFGIKRSAKAIYEAARINVAVSMIVIEMEGMKAKNKDRELRGEMIAYNDDAFFELQNEMNKAVSAIIHE